MREQHIQLVKIHISTLRTKLVEGLVIRPLVHRTTSAKGRLRAPTESWGHTMLLSQGWLVGNNVHN